MIRQLLLYDFFSLSYFSRVIKSFDIFVGMSYLQRVDSFSLLSGLFFFFRFLSLSYSNFHVISLKMGRLIAFELNLVMLVCCY